MRRVVITGLGAVSSIGCGKEDYWSALAAGKNGAGKITLFNTEGHRVNIAAEVKDFDPEKWFDKKDARRADRFIHFAVAAASLAVEDAKLDVKAIDGNMFGVYLGSGEGGINTTHENYSIMMEKGPSRVSPFFVPMMLSNMAAGYVAIQFGAKGPNMAVVTACASATHSMGEAMHAIVRGDADLVLTGGSEAAITPVAIAGFANMKALSTRNDDPLRASRPFDLDRDGFLMGEGAGVLLFEELEHAKKRGAHIYGEVTGYGLTCDAYHITAPDPQADGPVRAMRMAMKKAGWKPEDVDLINAHGTSTPLNDKMESVALHTVFGEHVNTLAVHSTKSMIGHALGAAGALETIAALMAVEKNIIHPTINYDTPDPECNVHVIGNKAVEQKVDRILINNFGFGGHNGVLAVERFKG
ncbi:MAG: beta-ketoacyl-ACP synthase II [Synergistaceae bacterium]|nr:beta-ketoacyl-ACP synthase II [Synergistaceae bacterium]MBP9627435.1 beta-ketoacyl-ACP synthase II [Synergistaceae bacterium]MBP9957695.1 beta-ketoacyl-ACP synthase II [Synergistaceae bacterium]